MHTNNSRVSAQSAASKRIQDAREKRNKKKAEQKAAREAQKNAAKLAAAAAASKPSPPPAAAQPPASAQPVAKARSYSVNEQFLGNSLDPALWEVITYPTGYRNNEEQDYIPSQVSVNGGMLQITASRDAAGRWHSGEVHSKWAYTYGDFEVRMAVSATGPGVWPAAWLMGTTDHWPNGGEIDIFENVNGSPEVHGTIHGGGAAGHWQQGRSMAGIDVRQFHTYKISKRPGYMSWWVDGVKGGEWHQSQTPAGGIWPFETHKNFGLLNLAIGGTWPGPSTAATPSNIVMSVDYFAVIDGS